MWSWPSLYQGLKKGLLTNLPSVKDLEQTPRHVFHTAEFANINGHIIQCRKVYALEFYDNSYLGYKDILCNSVIKADWRDN